MKLGRILIYVLAVFSLNSCSLVNVYYSDVVSRVSDSTPQSFTIVSKPGVEYDYLEFNDYKNVLTSRLEELGYTQAQSEMPGISIVLDYYIGDKFLVARKTTVQENTQTESKKDDKDKSGDDKKITSRKTSTSTSRSIYGIPVSVEIEAVSNYTNLPVWKIKLESIVADYHQVSEIIPWLINTSQWYIGKSWSGRVLVGVGYDIERHFGQNYNLDGVREVQSQYYKDNYDEYLTSTPFEN